MFSFYFLEAFDFCKCWVNISISTSCQKFYIKRTLFNLLYTLSVLIFACIYFRELKKIVFRKYLFSRMGSFWKFREYLFLRMASFWTFRVYRFQLQRKKNVKKTVESRDIRLTFLLRLTERQAGHHGVEKLLLLIDSK